MLRGKKLHKIKIYVIEYNYYKLIKITTHGKNLRVVIFYLYSEIIILLLIQLKKEVKYMEQQIILNKVCDIILPYLNEPSEIKMEMHFLKDLMINSVDYTCIIADIEDAFNIVIDETNIYCIKDLVQFIMQYNKNVDSE